MKACHLITVSHYLDIIVITWVVWHLLCLITRLFVQQFVEDANKEIIKAPHYYWLITDPLCTVDSPHKMSSRRAVFPYHESLYSSMHQNCLKLEYYHWKLIICWHSWILTAYVSICIHHHLNILILWGCVISVYPFPSWRLREYTQFVLLSSSNPKYELLPIV